MKNHTDIQDMKVQFNTRVSIRMRSTMDDYMDYMQKPLDSRLPESENWPNSIVDIMDDALTTFFADHPQRPRKGPKTVKRKTAKNKTNAKNKTKKKGTK